MEHTCYNCACDGVCDHNLHGWEECGNWQPVIVRCKDCIMHDSCYTEEVFKIAKMDLNETFCCCGKTEVDNGNS